MPQASDALRSKMGEYFGDEIDDTKPYEFLNSQGLREQRGHWTVPADFPVTAKVINCLNFLCDEWDHAWKWQGVV